MKLTDNQRKILEMIIDKYENSKTYEGTNEVNQSFNVRPDQIWKCYYDDSASVDMVNDFEREVHELEAEELVSLEYSSNDIKLIKGNIERFSLYYKLLNRKSKREKQKEYVDYFSVEAAENNVFASQFSAIQLKKAETGKKLQYAFKDCKEIIKILKYMENNREELLERELSIILFGDSKKFKELYMNKITSFLLKTEMGTEICKCTSDEKECVKALLEKFNIYSNPSYIYVKGKAELKFGNGSLLYIAKEPIAISSAQVKTLENVTVHEKRIVTVENLTSFHRVNEDNTFYIYLSGYHNSIKQQFIKNIKKENADKEWYHFGDIDPDGLYILENLKAGTGIDFKPLYMGIKELKYFKDYTKKLEKNDIIKAKNMKLNGLYSDLVTYMLENNCKLEQEIVSLNKTNKICCSCMQNLT